MKLSEVLNSDEALLTWLGKYATFKRFDTHDEIPIENITVENGAIGFKGEEPTDFKSDNIKNDNQEHFVWLHIDMNGEIFNPPSILKINRDIVLCDYVILHNAIINDWSKLNFDPTGDSDFDYAITGDKTVVNSWNGMQTLNAWRLSFNWESNELSKIQCSLMPLLDLPRLNAIYYYLYGITESHPEWAQRLEKACNIVTEYLESNKDHFACQSELIDAGLDEFA